MALEPFVGSANTEPSTGKGNGVTVEGQRATSFGKAPAPQTPSAEPDTAPAVVEPTPNTEPPKNPVDLLSSLSSPPATQTPEVEPKPNGGQSDPPKVDEPKPADEKAEMREMLKQLVQDEFGVDLASLKQAEQKRQYQDDVSQLQTMWGTNAAETSQRLAILSDALSKMPEASRQAFVNPVALNVLWTAVNAQTSSQAPAWNSSPASAPASSQLTKEQIENMSRDEYARRQPEIQAFYRQQYSA